VTRLRDLQPRYSASVSDHSHDGIRDWRPNGNFQLIFRCPVCGHHELSVYLGPTKKTHHATPFPPDGDGWLDKLTVTPSIDNSRNVYRRGQCTFHGHIINGDVTTS
jgi:hypothetical protein